MLMIGLGTLINTGAVVVSGLTGLLLKKGISEAVGDALIKACGLSTIFIGIAGAVSKMITFKDGSFETQGTMLMIISLVAGTLIGELLHIEQLMDTIGEKLKKAAGRESDNRFVEGFVNTSLVICVGAMAVVGSIQDGTTGDWSMLAAKSVLDAVLVLIFASTYGAGVVFSAIPIFVLQGSITAIAALCGSFVSDTIIGNIGFIGSVLVFCVGINIVFGKKFRVGNMVPAVFVPIVYEIAQNLIAKF